MSAVILTPRLRRGRRRLRLALSKFALSLR